MQSQMGASNTPTCISAIRDAYKSCTKAPTNSARPLPTHTPVHLQAGPLPSSSAEHGLLTSVTGGQHQSWLSVAPSSCIDAP